MWSGNSFLTVLWASALTSRRPSQQSSLLFNLKDRFLPPSTQWFGREDKAGKSCIIGSSPFLSCLLLSLALSQSHKPACCPENPPHALPPLILWVWAAPLPTPTLLIPSVLCCFSVSLPSLSCYSQPFTRPLSLYSDLLSPFGSYCHWWNTDISFSHSHHCPKDR